MWNRSIVPGVTRQLGIGVRTEEKWRCATRAEGPRSSAAACYMSWDVTLPPGSIPGQAGNVESVFELAGPVPIFHCGQLPEFRKIVALQVNLPHLLTLDL